MPSSESVVWSRSSEGARRAGHWHARHAPSRHCASRPPARQLVGVLLWLSVIHVVGPDVLAKTPVFSLLIVAAGLVACAIDHVLLLRRIR
jgi:hypothetical protein